MHSSQPYYKSTGLPANTLKLEVEGNNYKDVAFVSFNQEASDESDNFDVRKMFGLDEAPQLYSILPDELLSINTLSTLQGSTFVDLGFECAVTEIFTINAGEIESFDKSVSIYLEDKLEGINIDLYENPVYTFAHDPLNEADRFVLHFEAPNDIIELPQEKEEVKIFSYANKVYVIPEEITMGNIFIYDLLGQEIKNTSLIQDGKTIVNVENGTGYFIVKVVTENSVVSKKVFIK